MLKKPQKRLRNKILPLSKEILIKEDNKKKKNILKKIFKMKKKNSHIILNSYPLYPLHKKRRCKRKQIDGVTITKKKPKKAIEQKADRTIFDFF